MATGAANFYAQASGKTAFVNLHVAPGLGNAIGMIYGALKNNSPMVVTAGQQDTRMRLRDPVLGGDLVAIAAPVTKWSVQVQTADGQRYAAQAAQLAAAGQTHPLAGIVLQRQLEARAYALGGGTYEAPGQLVGGQRIKPLASPVALPPGAWCRTTSWHWANAA